MKKIISFLLALVLVCTMIPSTALARTNGILYGDANDDGSIDLHDVLILRRYLAEQNPAGFHMENVDVNNDGTVSLTDLLMLKKYMAEWDIDLGPELLTVSFYDGTRLIDALPATEGYPLGEVPDVTKSSKDNAILEGYYTDTALTETFYSDDPVTENTNVYAKYEEMGSTEELTLTSFAQMDASSSLSFSIVRASGSIAPEEAAILEVKDGSQPVVITVTDDDGDGTYTVCAPAGFNEGCSYQLTLSDGWNFSGKSDSIRTASFTIAMDEVENLQMSEDIRYIKDTALMTYSIGGTIYQELTDDLITSSGGLFSYAQAGELQVNDILCIYVGTKPTDRSDGSDLLDPVVYVKVSSISGTTVFFEPLGAEDQIRLYHMPNNFPLIVSSLPTGTTGSVNISALDTSLYATMMGSDGTYAKALAGITVGDFLSLYVSQESITSDEDIYFAQITAYDSASGEITYTQVDRQTILDSMDLYNSLSISGSDIISEEERQTMEQTLLNQIAETDFATQAAEVLTDVITRTDGFRNNMTVQQYLLTDSNGIPLSDDQIQLLNLGAGFELTDDIDLNVELITSGDQLHYNGGVQLAISVEASFEVETSDGGHIAIELSATFVEEVQLSPSARGELVTKTVLFIPVPIGVTVNANIDIRNFTALSFNADIYTVAPEDEELWDKFKGIMDDPTSALGLVGIPEEYQGMMKTVGDIMDKIDELQEKIDKANETIDQIQGYQEDLTALWKVVEGTGLTSEDDWKQMGQTLGKTTIASDLLELMNLTTETEISSEYLEDLQALMDKFSEVVQKETDWVELVNQEMLSVETNFYGIVIGVSANFVVRADLSISIGSNLEYEVGKRYTFWFSIGLFTPTSGSSSMDLLDEHFAFQFYVMGRVGLKMGVRAKIYVGIGSGKFASIGVAAELGPYVKLYGFFVYEYTKCRAAGMQNWTTQSRMGGALYLDFGLYFILSFEANALGDLFEYSYDFVDAEFPLLTAGNSRYYYGCSYVPEEDESVVVRDSDGDASNGISMNLGSDYLALNFMDLDTGIQGSESLPLNDYIFTLSNANFSFDRTSGDILVNVPEGTRYMTCDLTITYRHGKLAFSQYDMSVTIPLVWTNLTDSELSEYYTASVRVGNNEDGYETVWSQKVLKGQSFDLPDDEQIKSLIGWNDAKYAASTGYGSQKTENLTLTDHKVYDYNVGYKTYYLTVTGIENADGSTRSRTYSAKYGESFDFSDLLSTGTDVSGKYTRYNGLTTDATIEVGGTQQALDLTQTINSKMAALLTEGVTARATYVDDSVKATFTFTGADVSPVETTVRKGTAPSSDIFENVAANLGLSVSNISPALTTISANTRFDVTLKNLQDAVPSTISFDSNGGSATESITKLAGSLVGTLPTPTKTGYRFDGWFTDNGTFQNAYTATWVSEGNITLYAKWTANTYTVTFHENGGDTLDASLKTKTVSYGEGYGTLPAPTRTGYSFNGWYTAAENGTKVSAENLYLLTDNQTLYAEWTVMKAIDSSIFNFGDMETYTYTTRTEMVAAYTFTPEENATYTEQSFTFRYKLQGGDYIEGLPTDAGTYDVLITREAGDGYERFEHLYPNAVKIEYITYSANTSWYEIEYKVCKDSLGSSESITGIEWSNGDMSTMEMDINKSYNSRTDSKTNSYPAFISVSPGYGAVSYYILNIEVYVYDLNNNSRKIVDFKDNVKSSTFAKDWNVRMSTPADNLTSTLNAQVDSCSRIAVNMTTFGVNDKLSGLTYTCNSDAVTQSGDSLIIEGALLNSGMNTITVKTRNERTNSDITLLTMNVTCNIVE